MPEENSNSNIESPEIRQEQQQAKAEEILQALKDKEVSQEKVLSEELYREFLDIAHESGNELKNYDDVDALILLWAEKRGEEYADQFDLGKIRKNFFEQYAREKIEKIDEEVEKLKEEKEAERHRIRTFKKPKDLDEMEKIQSKIKKQEDKKKELLHALSTVEALRLQPEEKVEVAPVPVEPKQTIGAKETPSEVPKAPEITEKKGVHIAGPELEKESWKINPQEWDTISEERKDELLQKFQGKRVYHFTKEGEKQYLKLKPGSAEKGNLIFELYNLDGTRVLNDDGTEKEIVRNIKKIKYREWKKAIPSEREKYEEAGYRHDDGKIETRIPLESFDEEGKAYHFNAVNTEGQLQEGNFIPLQEDEIVRYENDGKVFFARRTEPRPEAEVPEGKLLKKPLQEKQKLPTATLIPKELESKVEELTRKVREGRVVGDVAQELKKELDDIEAKYNLALRNEITESLNKIVTERKRPELMKIVARGHAPQKRAIEYPADHVVQEEGFDEWAAQKINAFHSWMDGQWGVKGLMKFIDRHPVPATIVSAVTFSGGFAGVLFGGPVGWVLGGAVAISSSYAIFRGIWKYHHGPETPPAPPPPPEVAPAVQAPTVEVVPPPTPETIAQTSPTQETKAPDDIDILKENLYFYGLTKEEVNKLNSEEAQQRLEQFKRETHKIQEILQNEFKRKNLWELSRNLPENPYVREAIEVTQTTKDFKGFHEKFERIAKLKEYVISRKEIDEYNAKNPENIKSDFKKEWGNDGWKLHLNVSAENAKQVSEYLIQNGYEHKFLSGGEIEDGKIFTVYVGSYALISTLAQVLSKDLEGILSKPAAHGEIEFAPGIVGRFVGDRATFSQYGLIGFSLLNQDNTSLYGITNRIRFAKNESEKEKDQADLEKWQSIYSEKAYWALIKKYGDYFFPKYVPVPEPVKSRIEAKPTPRPRPPMPRPPAAPGTTPLVEKGKNSLPVDEGDDLLGIDSPRPEAKPAQRPELSQKEVEEIKELQRTLKEIFVYEMLHKNDAELEGKKLSERDLNQLYLLSEQTVLDFLARVATERNEKDDPVQYKRVEQLLRKVGFDEEGKKLELDKVKAKIEQMIKYQPLAPKVSEERLAQLNIIRKKEAQKQTKKEQKALTDSEKEIRKNIEDEFKKLEQRITDSKVDDDIKDHWLKGKRGRSGFRGLRTINGGIDMMVKRMQQGGEWQSIQKELEEDITELNRIIDNVESRNPQ